MVHTWFVVKINKQHEENFIMPLFELTANVVILPLYIIVVNAARLHRLRRPRSLAMWLEQRKLNENEIYVMHKDFKDARIAFFNNEVRYNIIYKRMNINKTVLYIPMEEYAKWYIDHKIKVCTSICEMLGVLSLRYHYNEFINELRMADVKGGYSSIDASARLQVEKSKDVSDNVCKMYDKGECKYLFQEPETFEAEMKNINKYFMDNSEYESDFDLRNLVRSRLIGNMLDYTLKYEVNFLSEFEVQLAMKFYGSYGVHFKRQTNKKLNVQLSIKFYKLEDLITTDNMNINDNRCLQLILHGPSPPSYYQRFTELAQIEAMVNNGKDNDQISINIAPLAPAPATHTQDTKMIYNFIERYLDTKFKQQHDHDDIKSYFAFYLFIKIADTNLLDSYIRNIRSLDDLDENGYFSLSLRTTVFASLLSFDDDGFYKLQRIYVNTLRQFNDVEVVNDPTLCYNLRCLEATCNSPYRHLKRIFVYIMRTYNNSNPDNLLTVEMETDSTFSKLLHFISMNIIVIPQFFMFEAFVTEKLDAWRKQRRQLNPEPTVRARTIVV